MFSLIAVFVLVPLFLAGLAFLVWSGPDDGGRGRRVVEARPAVAALVAVLAVCLGTWALAVAFSML